MFGQAVTEITSPVSSDSLQFNGGGPVPHFDWWTRMSHIPEGDRSIHEAEVMCRALHAFGTFDQLYLPQL